MSLLTPSESYALQSFLSGIDYGDNQNNIAPEWSMYTANTAGSPPPPPPQHHHQSAASDANNPDTLGDEDVPHLQGTEQLARATKDLMSLDSNHPKWSDPPDRDLLQQHQLQRARDPTSPGRTLPPPTLNMHAFPPYSIPRAAHHRQPTHRPPVPLRLELPRLSSNHRSQYQHHQHQQSPLPQQQQHLAPPTPSPSSSKRPHANDSLSAALPLKKARPAAPPAHPAVAAIASSKPSLLSPSQKKANHIQSEQKRRANIRRGYEALCETVPALREAIHAEEMALAAAAAGTGVPKSKKRHRGRKAQNDDGEKVDGRAGPRSENVVLQKTIDYVNELLSDRSALLARLHHARNSLARGHPALVPQTQGIPLWDRKWTGGLGMDDNDGEGDSDDDED